MIDKNFITMKGLCKITQALIRQISSALFSETTKTGQITEF